MDKKTFNKNANNIMWVEYWITRAHPSFKDYELYAERYDECRWICEIELPLINKTVSSISEKEVNAVLNATNKAAKLINEYMKEHPELEIVNSFKGKRWEVTSDEDGRIVSSGMSSAWRRQIGKQMERMTVQSFQTIKKAVDRIAKINGSKQNLFIQVLSKSLFDENKTRDEIMHKVNDMIEEQFHMSTMAVCLNEDDDNIIVVGYTVPLNEGGLH